MIVTWGLYRSRRLGLVSPVGDVHIQHEKLALWSVCYFLTWIIAGPYLQMVIRAFVPSPVSLLDAWRVWTVASLAGYMGFLLMGGVGLLRELSISILLADFLFPADALVVAIGSRLILLCSGILWAGVVIIVIRSFSILNHVRYSEGGDNHE
jgi:hypothetical protein